MNIHKRGIALSGRFCRLEHPSNTHTHHPRKKTSTSSTKSETKSGRRQVPQVRNLKPKSGRRQVPQVRIWNQTPPKEEDKYLKYEIWNQTPPKEEDKYLKYEIWNQKPPTEEDKYLKYESETKNHPRKKTSTSSTNLKPKTTQGRRQVPQVRIWNQKPPKEEDKYLKYESETKTPRRKTKTQKYRKHAVKTRSIPIATQELAAPKKKIHQPSNTKKRKTLKHVKLQNITNSSKRQSIMGI